MASGVKLPKSGKVFISVRDRQAGAVEVARDAAELGFTLSPRAAPRRRSRPPASR
jgi:hypothetical protein